MASSGRSRWRVVAALPPVLNRTEALDSRAARTVLAAVASRAMTRRADRLGGWAVTQGSAAASSGRSRPAAASRTRHVRGRLLLRPGCERVPSPSTHACSGRGASVIADRSLSITLRDKQPSRRDAGSLLQSCGAVARSLADAVHQFVMGRPTFTAARVGLEWDDRAVERPPVARLPPLGVPGLSPAKAGHSDHNAASRPRPALPVCSPSALPVRTRARSSSEGQMMHRECFGTACRRPAQPVACRQALGARSAESSASGSQLLPSILRVSQHRQPEVH
jgi:hypothetical protein